VSRISAEEHDRRERELREPKDTPTVLVRNKLTGNVFEMHDDEAEKLLSPSPAHPSQHHGGRDERAAFDCDYELVADAQTTH
jgi:hypothetical protein